MKKVSKLAIFDQALVKQALLDALVKLDPRVQIRNLPIFLVFVGAIILTFIVGYEWIRGIFSGFDLQLMVWLWFTVLFANFAEAIAEGRGKAQAESLRAAKRGIQARKLAENGGETLVSATALRRMDVVVCEAGDVIPADGDVIEGVASVDESAITGESAPVIRESGGDRSAVTGGTKVISDRIVVRITVDPGQSFLDRMITLVEGARRQRTPNEIALSNLLVFLTIIFLMAVVTLKPQATYSEIASGTHSSTNLQVLIALIVCLIPTTIGGLLSAIGISGMDRLMRRNVIALSGKAVEAAGDVDVMLLDKTGTITFGNRMASEFHPTPGVAESKLAGAALLASLADETPEGRSIVIYIKEQYKMRMTELPASASLVNFSAKTRMSGVDIGEADGSQRLIRKGAVDAIKAMVESQKGSWPMALTKTVEAISQAGGTPLAVSEGGNVLGVIALKDVIKGGIRERFADLRRMGIRTVMITGDNPLTAAAIAAEAGVDDFIAQATPETKLQKIRAEQAGGHLVAMIGDGTNDAPALAQADVGVAMNTGTQAAREAGNMVDLDSNPTKLIEIVEIGKQLLMTRGSLTTFSIANDIAKYFAIIPAMFASLYVSSTHPAPLKALDIMHLHSPESAVLSAIIFNALIIVLLIPLALKGVAYRPQGISTVLRRNLLLYGLGGIIVPFVGIKLIDIVICAIGLI